MNTYFPFATGWRSVLLTASLAWLSGCANTAPVVLANAEALPADQQSVLAIEVRDPRLQTRFCSVVDGTGKTLWNFTDASGAVKALVLPPGRYKVQVMVFYQKNETTRLKSEPLVMLNAKAGGQYLFYSYFSTSEKAVAVDYHDAAQPLLAVSP